MSQADPPSPTPAPAVPGWLTLRGVRFSADRPAVMAVVNRTDDSFYPGNRFADLDAAMGAFEAALGAGADIVDVGGVRAGQLGAPVGVQEEIDRIAPFLAAARGRRPDVILSVDTWRSPVLDAVAHLGVDLVNDTWAGHDPGLVEVAARIGAGVVVSHTGGLPPRTDPGTPYYGPHPGGVVDDVVDTLRRGAHTARQAGIPAERVLLDPTLDFGKTTRQSLLVLRHTERIVALGYPVMQAISRKDFVGETLDLPVEERLEGSLAATAVAAWLGATVFRTHDVAATRRTVDMVASIRGERDPVREVRGVSHAPRRPERTSPGG